jgi:hypothetical protein
MKLSKFESMVELYLFLILVTKAFWATVGGWRGAVPMLCKCSSSDSPRPPNMFLINVESIQLHSRWKIFFIILIPRVLRLKLVIVPALFPNLNSKIIFLL